jgi:hypothetical protein
LICTIWVVDGASVGVAMSTAGSLFRRDYRLATVLRLFQKVAFLLFQLFRLEAQTAVVKVKNRLHFSFVCCPSNIHNVTMEFVC